MSLSDLQSLITIRPSSSPAFGPSTASASPASNLSHLNETLNQNSNQLGIDNFDDLKASWNQFVIIFGK